MDEVVRECKKTQSSSHSTVVLQIWYSHSRWHAKEGGGGPSAAASILSKAREALPDCAMLRFAAADLEESRGEIDNARAMYEELVAVGFLTNLLAQT